MAWIYNTSAREERTASATECYGLAAPSSSPVFHMKLAFGNDVVFHPRQICTLRL